MTFEWIRFGFTAALLATGIISLFISVLGTFRFKFALNRIHSTAVSDTFSMFFILVGLIFATGFDFSALKLLLVLLFMWFVSPISSHMLTSLEYHTDEHLKEHCKFKPLKNDGEEK